MKTIKRVIELLREQKISLEEEIKALQEDKEEARKEGDLSENAAYQEANVKLNDATTEYLRVLNILQQSEEVEETVDINRIDIGSIFYIKQTLPGNLLDISRDGKAEFNGLNIMYVEDKNVTVIEGRMVFGGETERFTDLAIFSSKSELGKFLIGKPVGNYKFITKFNKVTDVEIRCIKNV